MSKLTCITLILLLSFGSAMAQSGKKPAKEKPPTNKEMEDMMKEAGKMMGEMDPETKKMMDSLGIKMPDMNQMKKNASGISDQQLAEAAELEGRVIPPKNTALIAAIPKKIFTPAELLAYVRSTNTSIAGVIPAESKQIAENLMAQFRNDKYYGALIASAANGMWASGYKESAVYLMGKAIEVLPNGNNYNNYAAYLTMLGAAHMAIPVLNKLNNVYKKNSTILNNLGQAWLQLGDEEKAIRYLDSTILVYAYHPQANFTKSLIQESKGDHAGALESLRRSMKYSVTKTKLNKWKELEKDRSKAFPGNYPVPKVYYSSSFNLGLYTALIPKEYAKTMGLSAEAKWEKFREQIREEKDRIDGTIANLNQVMEADLQQVSAQAIRQKGFIFPPWYQKAVYRYKSYEEGQGMKDTRTMATEGAKYLQEWALLKAAFSQELTKERKRFEEESKNGNNYYNCDGEMPIITRYVSAINKLNEAYNEQLVRQLVSASYQRFYYMTSVAMTDASALKVVLELKSDFLQKLLGLKHEAYTTITECLKSEEESPYKKSKLPDYDEVNCNILNTIWFPGWGSIVMRCNTMSMTINSRLLPVKGSITANFDGFVEQFTVGVKLKAADIDLGARFDKDGNFVSGHGSVESNIKGIDVKANGEVDPDGFKKGSIELGIDGKLKGVPEGLEGEAPVELGLKGELGVGMEFDREGNTDFIVKTKIEGEIGSNVETDNEIEMVPGMMTKGGAITDPEKMKLPLPGAPSVSVSAENEWSVNSGFSTTKGSLSGIRSK